MTNYLNNINSPADLKKLSVEQLPDLAEEIRQTSFRYARREQP